LKPITSATIDCSALRHNLQVLKKMAPHSRVMAVVKANAYGHGLIPAARALDGVDAFAVARLEEGISLRNSGIKLPVVLLEGVLDTDQLQAAAEFNFELVVHTREQIELLSAVPAGFQFRIWLKLDSGMNRLGFKAPDFGSALKTLQLNPNVRQPVGLFTHMASADLPDRAATQAQLALFAEACRTLPGERCIENSAALLGYPEGLADWIRPGLLLYGVSPLTGSTGADFGLKAVMTLRSNLIAVKDVLAGEKVGYGGAWTAKRKTRLAIAAIGYGDGYPRALMSGTPVLVNGERAVLAGRVSMDMIGIDVTDLHSCAKLGDPVILWGADLPVEEIAVWADTIPYELLCGISQRVAVDISPP